jgi:hypothetical protein
LCCTFIKTVIYKTVLICSSQRRPLTFVNQTLADVGHTLVSAGAFVFDDDVMSGAQLDRDGVQIQVQK